jgi:hypothetical protein
MAIYGTLEDATTYHAAHDNAAWAAAASDALRTAALVRATAYIDGRYRHQFPTGRWQSMFPGTRTDGRAQDLEWPRTDATDYEGNEIAADVVPVEVEHATYEAALRELADPGSLSPDFVPTSQVVKEKVGPIEVQYAEAKGRAPTRPVITEIDEIISPVIVKPARISGAVVV